MSIAVADHREGRCKIERLHQIGLGALERGLDHDCLHRYSKPLARFGIAEAAGQKLAQPIHDGKPNPIYDRA